MAEYYVRGKVEVQLEVPTFKVTVVPWHELLLQHRSVTGLIGKEYLTTIELDFDSFIIADSKEGAKKKAEDELLDLNTWTGSLYYERMDELEIGDGEWNVVKSVNINDITVEGTGDME